MGESKSSKAADDGKAETVAKPELPGAKAEEERPTPA